MTLDRFVPASMALGLLILAAFFLPERDALGRSLPLSLGFGVVFGMILQRSRFCFWCISADWFRDRDPRGLVGILAALAVGSLGHFILLGAWVPDPFAGRLPPDAHIGPVTPILVLGAASFGLGMALSGSCVSAHLYRLGEGHFGSIVALFGTAIGFAIGFLIWNPLFLALGHLGAAFWLPAVFGHGGALVLQLGVLALLAVPLLRRWPQSIPTRTRPFDAILSTRWPTWVGGILIGTLATLAYFRVGPLGVTAEIGSLSRTAVAGIGLLPETLYGLDGLQGCATAVKEALLSRNGLFILGLVIGSFATATIAGDFRAALPGTKDLPRLLLGGILLGVGAMLALGCTVGVILSGTMAGAVSGWVFAVICLTFAWIGWRLRTDAKG
jgi:uncharacterized membrane protein YedE/YeeE